MDDEELRAKVKSMHDEDNSYEHFNALPNRVLAAYGARGYTAYDHANEGERYYDLDALPVECPFPGKLAAEGFIDRVWAPLAERIPKFVAALRGNCSHVIVLHRTTGDKNKRGWFAGYFLDRAATMRAGAGRYSDIWGREPFERPKLGKKARAAGFTLPASLRQFYNVHNGLGLSGSRTHGVEALASARNLEALNAEHPDLLEVYCDSGGNRKAYPRGEDRIVDWDRSTHDRANDGSLWTLFDRELIRYVTGEN